MPVPGVGQSYREVAAIQLVLVVVRECDRFAAEAEVAAVELAVAVVEPAVVELEAVVVELDAAVFATRSR